MASQALDIRSGFSNRTMFITGGTGFVGKVALYKILKEFPDIKRIYLLMRGKKSRKFKRFLNAQERLDLEVLGSPCFDTLRKDAGDAKWKQLCDKVKAVDGDITKDHIGLSEEALTTLANEVQMIIHLAATVNFNERLDLAIQMNTLGGMRVLALAKTCKNLESMVHVSTCYVNFPRAGRDNINEEKIYPLDFDPEEMVKVILGLHESEVERESARILKQHNFGNTYTFTKNIGEQLIYRYKGDVPVVVVRPSIVGCSYREPTPGWVDALTAAGGLILTTSLGVVREIVCDEDMVADVIPVDMVVSVILKALFKTQVHYKARRAVKQSSAAALGEASVATPTASTAATAVALPQLSVGKPAGTPPAHVGRTVVHQQQSHMSANPPPAPEVSAGDADELPFIYQAAVTGTGNHISWGRFTRVLRNYMAGRKRHPLALSNFDVTVTKSSLYYQFRYNVLRVLPYLALKTYVNLPPPIGVPAKRRLVEKLGKAVRRASLLNREFHDFIVQEWFFMSTNSQQLDDGLNDYSKKAFHFDPYAINGYAFLQMYLYGIYKYIVRDTGDFTLPEVPVSATDIFFQAASL